MKKKLFSALMLIIGIVGGLVQMKGYLDLKNAEISEEFKVIIYHKEIPSSRHDKVCGSSNGREYCVSPTACGDIRKYIGKKISIRSVGKTIVSARFESDEICSVRTGLSSILIGCVLIVLIFFTAAFFTLIGD